MSKLTSWMNYRIDRTGQNWPAAILVARYMNDPNNWNDYDVINLHIIEVNDKFIDILVEQQLQEGH